jgi:hypothetical protein
MKLTLRILAVAAGVWACLSPFIWLIFCNGWWGPRGIAVIIFTSSVGLVVDIFRRVPVMLWIMMLVMLLSAGSVGIFHHFQDSGESGPLPYEWLNSYYASALPLILVSLATRMIGRRMQV